MKIVMSRKAPNKLAKELWSLLEAHGSVTYQSGENPKAFSPTLNWLKDQHDFSKSPVVVSVDHTGTVYVLNTKRIQLHGYSLDKAKATVKVQAKKKTLSAKALEALEARRKAREIKVKEQSAKDQNTLNRIQSVVQAFNNFDTTSKTTAPQKVGKATKSNGGVQKVSMKNPNAIATATATGIPAQKMPTP